MNRTRRTLIAAGLLLALLAGARVANRERVPAAPAEPEYLPEIVLNDLHGTPRALAEWSGRTLLINFWATWCAPCRREMPMLQALQDARGPESLRVIGIAIDRQEPVEQFIAEAGISYPILIGQQEAMAAAGRFGDAFAALPFTVLAAADGAILGLHTGELHAEDLAHMLDIADQVAAGELSLHRARERLAAGARTD